MEKKTKNVISAIFILALILSIFNIGSAGAQILKNNTSKNVASKNVTPKKVAPKNNVLKNTRANVLGTAKISEQEKIYQKVGVNRKLKNSTVDISLPSADNFRLAGSTEKNLDFWLQVLPEQDKGKDKYLVLPKSGLVMPINYVTKGQPAYERFVEGKVEDFIEQLSNGSVELPLEYADYGEKGNKVIMGHSSYYYKKARYRTHFQKIILMEKGDEAWVYQKNKETGEFERFVYRVFESYQVNEEDVSVLYDTDIDQLLLFTCTPIGGVSGRWIVKGEFVGN